VDAQNNVQLQNCVSTLGVLEWSANISPKSNFKLMGMSKNNDIIPRFVEQGFYLADPGPENRPQYHFRSSTVTQDAPEIFPASNKFLNWQTWGKIMKSYLYTSCKYCSWPTRGRKIDSSMISGPAQSPGIHLQYFFPAINFLIAGNGQK